MVEQKISILKEVFPSFRMRKGSEFVTYCPSESCRLHNRLKIDPKMKLEINLITDIFACWRCHYRGHTMKILKDMGAKSQIQRFSSLCGLKFSAFKPELTEAPLSLPAEYEFVLNCNSSCGQSARSWLQELQVRDVVIKQNRVGICSRGKYSNRLIFPSFDESGHLNYFITRHLYENNGFKWLKCEKSLKSVVFNEVFVDWTQPIVLVETVKAYLKHFDEIPNMIVCNGSFLSKEYHLFSKIVTEDCPFVYVAFDPDAKTESLKTLKNLDEFGVNCSLVDLTDQADNIDTKVFAENINCSMPFNRLSVLKDKINNLI